MERKRRGSNCSPHIQSYSQSADAAGCHFLRQSRPFGVLVPHKDTISPGHPPQKINKNTLKLVLRGYM